VGLAAVQYMFKGRLNPDELKGALAVFPIANPLGFQLASYVSPHDTVNLSVAYPGSKDGTITSRIANFISENAAKTADAVMDFHENVEPVSIFP